MENNPHNSTLRVVVKDLGGLVKREDLRPGKISVLVNESKAIGEISRSQPALEKAIRDMAEDFRTDRWYEQEARQINSQLVGGQKALYFKFSEIDTKENNELLIVDVDTPLRSIPLKKVMYSNEPLSFENDLLIKYQRTFNIVIITSSSFERSQKRAAKSKRQGEIDEKDDPDSEDEEGMTKHKTQILRKNPFNHKMTARDKTGFQQFHQHPAVNDLVNVTMSQGAKGSAVLEAMIKVANSFFLSGGGDSFNKNEHLKTQTWMPILREFSEYCARTLPPRNIERELLDLEGMVFDGESPDLDEVMEQEMIQEGGNEQQPQAGGEARNQAQQQAQQQVQQLWAFNGFEAEEIPWFIENFKDRIPYLLPNANLNHKLLLALSPNFLQTLFKTVPKNNVIIKKQNKFLNREELIKSIEFFLNIMASTPAVAVEFICISMNTMAATASSFGSKSLRRAIDFLVKFIKNQGVKKISEILQTNDTLRKLYFTTLGRLVFATTAIVEEPRTEDSDEFYLQTQETSSTRIDFSMDITDELLMILLIDEVPKLQFEFFNKLLCVKHRLPRLKMEYFLYMINNKKIGLKDRSDLIGTLFSRSHPVITREMAEFVHQIIMRPQDMTNMNFETFFSKIELLYGEDRVESFMKFMRKPELCLLHQAIFLGFRLTQSQEVKVYRDNHKNWYFCELYNLIVEFLNNIKQHLLVEFLVVKNILSDKKLDMFEIIHTGRVEKVSKNIIRGYIIQHANKLQEIRDNISVFVEVIKANELYFNEYKFFVYHRDMIAHIQKHLLQYTVDALEDDECYIKSKVLLNTRTWKNYNACQEYGLFYESLKKRSTVDVSLPDYFENVKKTMDEYRSKFLTFEKKESFTLADYNKYLPRILSVENLRLYNKIMEALDISAEIRETIFANCRIFHSLNKAIKVRPAMDTLLAAGYLDLKADKYTEHIRYVSDMWKGKDTSSVVLSEVIKSDKFGVLTPKNIHESHTYLMPMVLKDVANSYDTFKFIKETADEFIKSMREECDNENLDIVNKLDVINKNLKFLVNEKQFETIVAKFVAIPKGEQRKIKKYLRDLNSQIASNITHLADRTKKDQSYNQRLIAQVLTKSVINLKYNKLVKTFTVTVEYGDLGMPQIMGTVEFEELLNKAKIISENSNSHDEFNDLMRNFRDFGVQIEKLAASCLKLRNLGLIYSDTSMLTPLLTKATGRSDIFSTKDEGHILRISFNSQGRKGAKSDFECIQTANEELMRLESTLDKELLEYYSQDCYLMTYFYGKKLYFLTKYLRGQSTPEESEQTLALITESIPKNLIEFGHRHEIPEDLYGVFRAVYLTLAEWSSNTNLKERIKLNVSSIMASKKVKTCNAPLNVYRTICKILVQANESMVSLSQMLFCERTTTPAEVLSFCKRSLLDPFKRLYFIIGIDHLEYTMAMNLKNNLMSILESKNDNLNFNLLIFNNSQARSVSNMFENENFENINHALLQLDNMVADCDYQNAFANLFKTNTIVLSEMAGMGKTSWISQNLDGRELYEIFLSGDLNKGTMKRRLQFLSKTVKDKTHFALTIKLDFIEDFDVMCDSIDYLLFCLCIVRRYHTDIGCHNLRQHLSRIFIEASNTFVTEALTKLSVLELLNNDPKEVIPAGQQAHKFRVVMPKFDFNDVWFSTESKSKEQVVGKFLNNVNNETIGSQVSTSGPNLNKEAYVALLKKFYMTDIFKEKSLEERSNSTYSQYQFWLSSLYKLVTEMEEVKGLKIPNGSLSDQTKCIRQEAAKEILQFCSYIICVSVDQAKLSQDTMKEVMTELKKHNLQKHNLEEYQQKFNKITPWSSANLIIPLINRESTLFAMTSLDDVFNLPASPRHRKRIALRDHIRATKQFIEINTEVTNYSNECLTLLANFLGQNPSDVIERAKAFKGGKGFVITLDNFMKICLILLKSLLHVPIVMMGESGCGKTYLSEFVSECLLTDKMRELTLYAGVTELDFVKFMKEAVEDAKVLKESGKNLWVFFDEFNTSSLQSIVAEIMIDRVCSIEPSIYNIPDNMVFISCCNPFRMKTKRAEVGLVPKTSDTILSHRVYPIPERLLNYVWDFGQLSEADEKKHIISMVAAEKLFPATEASKEARFVNFLFAAHKTVRNIEERSGVSLRDIKRVLSLYRWFREKIEYLITCGSTAFKKNEIHIRATICAIVVAYSLRLNGRYKEQDELVKQITNLAKTESTVMPLNQNQIKETLAKLSDIYLTVLKNQRIRIIPDNIALNKPLKENFITMLACFDARIPLIICGAPGTSKTLCTQIFDNALVATVTKENKEFANFKGIHSIYYGGSQSSTSEGIAKVFYRAEQSLKQHGEDRPVVVFDEIGLAELSPYNPLKILHPLLERPWMDIGFFGLSNWTLDLSKMNRLIYLARPDMTKEDLTDIFKISTSNCKNDKVKTDLITYLGLLADAYLDYRVWQKANGNHPNFHGSRDIYGVSKFVYSAVSANANYDAGFLRNLIKRAIERNFNGAAYLFGPGPNEIKWEKIPGLQNRISNSTTGSNFNNLRIEDIGNPYGHSRAESPQVLNIFSSAQVFKHMFLTKLASKPELADLFRTDFFEDEPIFNLIADNINDNNSRFLLVKSEGEVVDNIFMERLAKLVKPELLKDWRGIKGKENSHELLSTLKSYISLGYIVVMKNLDDLYGSLYDLFNQKYSEVEGRKYCYLYFGESKHKVEVHPDFKAIILLNAESELQGLELELEQPAPFLNRFEKFFVRLANILKPESVKEVYELVGRLQKQLKGDMFKMICLSVDMITSIVLKAYKDDASKGKEEAERLLTRMATSNYLLSENLSKDTLDSFKQEHPYSNIWSVLSDMKIKPAHRLCVYTFSNPIDLEHMRNDIQQKSGATIINSEELINQGLEARSERMKRYEDNFIIIQFTNPEHLALVAQLKASINENSHIKRALFVIHLDRRAKDMTAVTKNIGLNFWNEWDNVVLEDLSNSNYQELTDVYDLGLSNLLFNERHALGLDLIKEACLFALQQIVIETNDDSLKVNIDAIRDMLFNDPDNMVATSISNKLRQSKLLDSEEKWRNLVAINNGSKQTYSDVKSEILAVVISKYGDILKRYMVKLNEDLNNLGSYACHFNNPDPKVRGLYRDTLAQRLSNSTLTRQSIQMARYSQKSFRLPFLNSIYDSFSKEYSSKMIEENRDSYEQLGDTQARYTEYNLSKTKNPEVIEDLRTAAKNGEEFIFNTLKVVLDTLIESIKSEYPQVFESALLKESLVFDIIFVMIRKWEDSTERLMKQRADISVDKSKLLNIMRTKYLYFLQVCEAMSGKHIDGASSDISVIDTILITSSIVSICFQADLRFIFSLVDMSNIELLDFKKLLATICQQHANEKDVFRLDYKLPMDIIKTLQSKVIPDVKDDKINLKFLKNRFSEIISDSIRSANVKGTTKNYDLKYMVIFLELLEILPRNQTTNYLSEISQKKREQDRHGGNFDIQFIKEATNKILKIIHHNPDTDKDKLALVVSEYVNTNAQSLNFLLFMSKDFDDLFNIFDREKQEMIASSLAHHISNNIEDYFSLIKFKRVLGLIDFNHTLSNYDLFLDQLDTSRPRSMYLLISLVDKLVYIGSPFVKALPGYEFIDIFEFILRSSNFAVSNTGLPNILRYSMIRMIFQPEHMEILRTNQKAIGRFDNLILETSRSKEAFINNINTFPITYFLQSIITETGDLSRYQMQYKAVTNICGLVMEEDASGSIIFFDEDVQRYYIDLNNKLSDYAYSNQVDKMAALITQSYKGSQKFNFYVVGVVLLNKFINPISKEDVNVILNIKNLFCAALNKVEMSYLYKKLLIAIVKGDRFNFKEFLGAETEDPNYEVRLKKVFYQFLLIAICFQSETGYKMDFYKQWIGGNFADSGFKAKIVSSDQVNNSASIFENIVVERLGDGSYQDYGAAYVANLGIYKCSCDYIYSIGNCGYAMVTRPCPKCLQPIGGENHTSVSRKGHDHVKTFEEFNSIIQRMYAAGAGKYNPHTVINTSSLELTPLKLSEIGVKEVIDATRKKQCKYMLDNFYNNILIRHMFDHMLIISLPEILEPEEAAQFTDSLRKLLPYEKDKNFKALFGRMSGTTISNHFEYFLAHVKNDIEQLSNRFNFRNPVRIFDYMRAIMSTIAENILKGGKMKDGDILINAEYLEEPQTLLPLQEAIANRIKDNKLDLRTVFKSILFRNISSGLIENLLKDKHGKEYEQVYNFMRHNRFEKSFIMKRFHEQLASTAEFGLLKTIVNYQGILKDFPRIVDINVKVPMHFNLHYDRAYNFDEATELDALTLEDGAFKRLYNEFKDVWEGVIPLHEDKNPEVFSFAFMCQQNLNVKNFIDGLLSPGGAKLIKLLFIDSNQYNDVNLLYMNSIVRTFVDKFHNSIVDRINKVLNLDTTTEGTTVQKSIEYCGPEDYLGPCNYEQHVLNNFFYSTIVAEENNIRFDFLRIEYLCAQDMKRPSIKFEAKDIRYYNFKNTNVTEFEARLGLLVKKIKPIRMDYELVKMFEALPEAAVSKSYEFMLEIGNYVLNNFLFNDETAYLRKFAMSKSEQSLLHRFSSYDEAIHSKLQVGHLRDLQILLRDLKFSWDLIHSRSMYSSDLSPEQYDALSKACEDPTVTAKDIKKVKSELRSTMIENYQQGHAFFRYPLSTFGFEMTDLGPSSEDECIAQLLPSQFLKIMDILNEGISLKGAKKSSHHLLDRNMSQEG